MKLVTFQVGTPLGAFNRTGALAGGGIIDLNAGYTLLLARNEGAAKVVERAAVLVPPDMLDFLDGEDAAMNAARATVAFVEGEIERGATLKGYRGETIIYAAQAVKLLAPIPRPRSIRECSVFPGHLWKNRQIPEPYLKMPIYWKGNPAAVIGPDEPALWPSFEQDRMDYELEFACVIGKKGRNVPREKAMGHVVGFTIFNDISARTMQRDEMSINLGPSKGKDTCNIFGPCIATVDEFTYPYELPAIVRINGKVVSESNTKHMLHKWDAIVAHAALDETIYPGDIITSGTVQDTETEKLKPGDLIELELGGIGVLRNRIMKEGPDFKY